MNRQGIKRLALVSVVVAALVGGVGVHPSGAKKPVKPPTSTTFAPSDCDTIQNIEVADSSNGYWGATARNAAKAYHRAAKKIENENLQTAMNNLADIWAVVGKENSVTAAAAITAKKGKAYGKALSVFTKAVVTCASQPLVEETTTTTTFDESSSDVTSDTSETSDTEPSE